VTAISRLRARVRAMDPFRVDVGIALLFCVAAAIEAALIDAHGKDRLLTALLAPTLLSWLALRRRRPVLGGVGFALALLVEAPLDSFLVDYATTPFIGLLLMLFSLARHADGRPMWAAFALFFPCLAVAVATSEDGLAVGDLFWVAFILILPFLAGRALRGRALLERELREKAERAEAERGERVRRAIEEERERIATELQAVVADGVSAMVVQAEAVPLALAAGDSARAGQAFGVIEETGRDALAEMRRLLGVLRRDGEAPALAPQPGLGRVEALVERVREAGLDVELRVIGARRQVATGVDLTAYRVLEDALEAASEQGATRAYVLVWYEERELKLEVSDDRAGGTSPQLAGLRDRVGLYGGHLRAGRRGGAGFRLQARLPIEAVGP
jgi:signal transduction histidine kinase